MWCGYLKAISVDIVPLAQCDTSIAITDKKIIVNRLLIEITNRNPENRFFCL
jgi:hypothetical protein